MSVQVIPERAHCQVMPLGLPSSSCNAAVSSSRSCAGVPVRVTVPASSRSTTVIVTSIVSSVSVSASPAAFLLSRTDTTKR